MSFDTLATTVKNKLAAITGIPTVNSFVAVYDYPPNDAEMTAGVPFAVVLDSDLQSEFDTTADNAREFVFIIHIVTLIEDPNTTTGLRDAYRTMRKIVDKVIDTFDNDQSLGGAADWTFPAPAVMNQRVKLPNGDGLLAEIRLRVRKDFTTS